MARARLKRSEYGIQLREKQKVKWMYGLLEYQFRGTFARADRKGITGTNLLVLLERRLDNVVYRLGFTIPETRLDNWCDIIIFWSTAGRSIFLPIKSDGGYDDGQGKKPEDRVDYRIHGGGGPTRSSTMVRNRIRLDFSGIVKSFPDTGRFDHAYSRTVDCRTLFQVIFNLYLERIKERSCIGTGEN